MNSYKAATSLASAGQKAAMLTNTAEIPDAMTFGKLLDRWFAEEVEGQWKIEKQPAVYVRYGKNTWVVCN